MPIFFQQDIDEDTKLGIWKIEEAESFFKVPLQRDITHPHKRLQHLAGRYLLQYLFPQFPTELIRIADTKKPFLENEAYHFSISHCGDFAAVLVSKTQRVGIDIEIPSEKVLKIAGKFLHPEEKKLLDMNLNPLRLSTLLWSAKESMFKWWGWGGIDFSEMLRLQPIASGTEGSIEAAFIKDDVNISLQVHFVIFPELVLAWMKTEPSMIQKVEVSTPG